MIHTRRYDLSITTTIYFTETLFNDVFILSFPSSVKIPFSWFSLVNWQLKYPTVALLPDVAKWCQTYLRTCCKIAATRQKICRRVWNEVVWNRATEETRHRRRLKLAGHGLPLFATCFQLNEKLCEVNVKENATTKERRIRWFLNYIHALLPLLTLNSSPSFSPSWLSSNVPISTHGTESDS